MHPPKKGHPVQVPSQGVNGDAHPGVSRRHNEDIQSHQNVNSTDVKCAEILMGAGGGINYDSNHSGTG